MRKIYDLLVSFWNWLDPGFRFFIVILFYIFGTIGGFGSALYCDAVPCAIGVVVLAVMAIPALVRAWRDYQEG